jgi:hypothetical protein
MSTLFPHSSNDAYDRVMNTPVALYKLSLAWAPTAIQKGAFIDGMLILEGGNYERSSEFHARLIRLLELDPRFLRHYTKLAIQTLLDHRKQIPDFETHYWDLKAIL